MKEGKRILVTTFIALVVFTAVVYAVTVVDIPEACYGDWAFCFNARLDGGGYAISNVTNLSNTTGRWANFTIDMSNATNITNVSVLADAWDSNNGGRLGIEVSWDAGNSWSALKYKPLTTTETTYDYDFTSATTWTASKLSDANFLVRARCRTTTGTPETTCYLDWLRTEITYS